jgi:UDPglucose 6-dehydrogenase
MRIVIIGTGYVGLVTGACLAELGNHVVCMDINKEKIENLKKGIMPIYEPGLEDLVKSNMKEERLSFITDLNQQTTTAEIYFIAVGTPSDEDGSADLRHVLSAAESVGQYIDNYAVIVDKSTVPVGSGDRVNEAIQSELIKRNKAALKFDVVSNPEFLKEGAAIDDFMRPDRVVVGCESDQARDVMGALYSPFVRNFEKIFFMSIRDAEMTKYVSNAMLATKISFINEIAGLCDALEVDVENVRMGVGSDRRIGYQFIYPGCGYGGSCFPKDVKALVKMAENNNFEPLVLNAVEKRNHLQKQVLGQKITKWFGDDLTSLNIALWGLSFKPGTDDMREASSVDFLHEVIKRGAHVKAYDPVAMEEAKRFLPAAWFKEGRLTLVDHQYDAVADADVMVLVTEWKPFCYPDMNALKKQMRKHYILDGRNQYDPTQIKAAGFNYLGIGRRTEVGVKTTAKETVE